VETFFKNLEAVGIVADIFVAKIAFNTDSTYIYAPSRTLVIVSGDHRACLGHTYARGNRIAEKKSAEGRSTNDGFD